MPELKNNFVGGKMNSDLDERLVPKGEYIDALNIDVLTSDGGNAGAIHNITGNTIVAGPLNSSTAKCVGIVSDEKNDCIYTLVADNTADYVLKTSGSTTTPVAVDLHGSVAGGAISGSSGVTVTFASLPVAVTVGDSVYAISSADLIVNEERFVGVILAINGNDVTIAFYDGNDIASDYIQYVFGSDRFLEFDKDTPITGINIIDGFLCWTSSISDPRKLNIQRCIDGTTSITSHTRLIINSVDLGDLKKEHVTVIKKSPHKAPDIATELTFGETPDTTSNINFSGKTAGSSIVITTSVAGSYSVGDTLLLKETKDVATAEELFPITRYYDVRLLVTAISGTSVTCVISSISDNTVLVTTSVLFAVSLLPVESLFNLDFPRFAYRYKYEDSEYSIVGPFSNPVFEASEFRLTVQDGYNKGMENRVRKIIIKNLVPVDIPKDVVQVDIIYKTTSSPTLYILESIKSNDPIPSGKTTNPWNADGSENHKGVFDITSEVVYKTLPSNQSIRVWDNVPLTALAQEVIGGRLVYANYTQGMDLAAAGGDNVQPVFTTTLQDRKQRDNSLIGSRTIKSNRDIQLGVAFSDEYMRETPVLTSASGGINIPYSNAVDSTMLVNSMQTQLPLAADNFRFYIKDTSNPYYNLPLSKIYETENGETWLSFNSADRNKIEEDTFLILKNKGGSDGLVDVQDKKYKILDIKSEVPNHILSFKNLIGQIIVNSANFDSFTNAGDLNNDTYVKVLKSTLDSSSPVLLTDALATGLVVRFIQTSTGARSAWTTVKGVNVETISAALHYVISFEKHLTDLVEEIDTADIMEVYQEEDRFKPEYSGRFFVKIAGDSVTNIIAKNTATTDFGQIGQAQFAPSMNSDDNTFFIKLPVASSNTSTDTITLNDVNGLTVGMLAKEDDYNSDYIYTITSINSTTKEVTLNINLQQNTGSGDYWHFSDGSLAFKPEWAAFSLNRWFVDRAYFYRRAAQASGNNYHENVGNTYNALNSPPTNSLSFPPQPNADSIVSSTRRGQGVSGPNAFANFPHGGFIDIAYGGISDDSYILPAAAREFKDALKKPGAKIRVGGDIFNVVNVNGMAVSNFKEHNFDNGVEITHASQRRVIYRVYTKENPMRVKTMLEQIDASSSLLLVSGSPVATVNTTTNSGVQLFNVGQTVTGTGIPGATTVSSVDYDANTVTLSANATTSVSSAVTVFVPTPATDPFLEIVTAVYSEEDVYNNEEPAIWETEPKEAIDTGIFQAIGSYYPKALTSDNIRNYINTLDLITNVTTSSVVESCIGINGLKIQVADSFVDPSVGDIIRVTKEDKSFISVEVTAIATITGSPDYKEISINPNFYNNPIGFAWYNAFAFGNGVESISARDEFNSNKLDSGAKASLEYDEYSQEHRKSGLIYSGIYNSTSGVNNLNQFIQGEKITKDLNPEFGSIQKLYARNSDLVAICEDKTYRILANKDALYNADGNLQLISTNNVLGQAIPFASERGISTNPESFAIDGYRAYWTHRTSGEVMRLSMDGLTPISRYGRRDYFKTALRGSTKIVGSFDDNKGLYNLTIDGVTNAYREESRGWVSRRSFTQEEGISMANRYFTAHQGDLWEFKSDSAFNTFYGAAPAKSSIKFVVNDQAGIVKSFKTMNYEGDLGWSTVSVTTNIESGTTTAFVEKEGMYSSNIKGIVSAAPDTSSLAVQGIGVVTAVNSNTITVATVNQSLSKGDTLYRITAADIANGGDNTVLAAVSPGDYTCVSTTGTTIDVTNATNLVVGDFILFSKDARVNVASLKGYFATVELETANTTLTELFSINSGVAISSK